MSDQRRRSIRRGLTLLELLVVVGIVMLLAVIAIPSVRPLAEGRRVREAARSINVYFGRARSRAVESGRSHGVLFERFDQARDASILLRQAEVPPPYSGDVVGAQVWPFISGGYVRLRIRPAELAPGLIRRGDLVQLNFQGPLYRIIDDLSDNSPSGDPSPPADPGTDFPLRDEFNDGDPSNDVYIDFTAGSVDPATGFSTLWLTLEMTRMAGVPWTSMADGPRPVPFQIMRQPTPSGGAPLQLPRGAVVELVASGVGYDVFAPDPRDKPDPVAVMFAPDGSIDAVYCYQLIYDDSGNVVGGDYRALRPIEPVYFLVGQWDRMVGAEDGLQNWQDGTNLWVTLSPQTGQVNVAEVMPEAGNPVAARELARQMQISKGGR